MYTEHSGTCFDVIQEIWVRVLTHRDPVLGASEFCDLFGGIANEPEHWSCVSRHGSKELDKIQRLVRI